MKETEKCLPASFIKSWFDRYFWLSDYTDGEEYIYEQIENNKVKIKFLIDDIRNSCKESLNTLINEVPIIRMYEINKNEFIVENNLNTFQELYDVIEYAHYNNILP